MSATTAYDLAPQQRRGRLERSVRGTLAAAIAFYAGHAALAGEARPLAGHTALSDAELATLRGGFITEDGLEVTFGMRLKFDLDNDLQLIAEFEPGSERDGDQGTFAPGGFRAEFRRSGDRDGEAATTVERKADGSVVVSGGSGGGIAPAGSSGIAIPGGTAEIENRADGFALSANGEVPVRLEQGPEGIVVVVGDSRTTLIEDRLGPEGFSARLSNRRNGAHVVHEALLDIDVHNFSELSTLRKAGIQRQRLQSLVNRGLVDFAARR